MSESMPEPLLMWAKVTEKPQTYKITRVYAQPGKMGRPDHLIDLDNEYRITVWGRNYQYLFNTFGRNSNDWIGKRITIWKNAEGHREIQEERT